MHPAGCQRSYRCLPRWRADPAGQQHPGRPDRRGRRGRRALIPDGGFLYVDENRIGKVVAFAVIGGDLTELASSRPRARRRHARRHRSHLALSPRPAGAAARIPWLRPRGGGVGGIRGARRADHGTDSSGVVD